ncbi:MAG: hypothetical protein WDN03_07010 [Rhizomicrobium sp.]
MDGNGQCDRRDEQRENDQGPRRPGNMSSKSLLSVIDSYPPSLTSRDKAAANQWVPGNFSHCNHVRLCRISRTKGALPNVSTANLRSGTAAADAAAVARARALGFDHLAADEAPLLPKSDLQLLANVDLTELPLSDPLVEAHPDGLPFVRPLIRGAQSIRVIPPVWKEGRLRAFTSQPMVSGSNGMLGWRNSSPKACADSGCAIQDAYRRRCYGC